MFYYSNYTQHTHNPYTWSSIHLLTYFTCTECLALFFISALFSFILSSLFFFSSSSHSSYFFYCLFFLISGNFCFSIYFGSGLFILATGWDYFSYMTGSLRLSESLASSFLSVMLCWGSSSFFLCYILIILSLRSNSSWSMELSILLWKSATLLDVKHWMTFYFLTLRVVCKVLIYFLLQSWGHCLKVCSFSYDSAGIHICLLIFLNLALND